MLELELTRIHVLWLPTSLPVYAVLQGSPEVIPLLPFSAVGDGQAWHKPAAEQIKDALEVLAIREVPAERKAVRQVRDEYEGGAPEHEEDSIVVVGQQPIHANHRQNSRNTSEDPVRVSQRRVR